MRMYFPRIHVNSIFSWLDTMSATSKATVAVITDVSACILRVQKTTTTNTGVKWSDTSAKTWTITPPWSNQKLGMPPPTTISHVKCAQIIKNLPRRRKSLLPVVSTISTSTSWPWCPENEHGNGSILIPASAPESQAQLLETFTYTIKEVFISCFALQSKNVSASGTRSTYHHRNTTTQNEIQKD